MVTRVRKILALGLLTLLILISLNSAPRKRPVQPAVTSDTIVQAYDPDSLAASLALRRDELSRFKDIPPAFELPILTTLSYYPQLADERIRFQLTDSDGSLYSRVRVASLLFPWLPREYVVLIDTVKTQAFVEPTLLENLPFEAQVGVLGHELAHTVSYLDKSAWEMIGFALRYALSKDFQTEVENATERRTIDFGLGHQLLAWSEFQYDIKIREGKDHLYFSPEKIRRILAESELYQGTN